MSHRKKSLRRMLPAGEFKGLTPVRSETMRAIKGKGNKSTEVRLRLALVQAGIAGWTVGPKSIFGTPDFYFPLIQFAIFVDGCFWHGCSRCGHIPKANRAYWAEKIKRNRARDRHVNAALVTEGIYVLRAWEHESLAGLQSLVSRIKLVLARRIRLRKLRTEKVLQQNT
jgi:DNA mismatch endonuclease, patch repair protein